MDALLDWSLWKSMVERSKERKPAMGLRSITRLERRLRDFSQRDDGATAVEFAMIAIPFFMLLLVIFDTAAMLFTDISLQNGVHQTARLIRTGQVQTQSISQTRFREILCDNVASYLDCSKIKLYITKSSTPTFANRTNMMAADDKTPERWEVGAASEWVLVQVSYDWKLFVPKFSMVDNAGSGKRRLTAGALFRNEPYGG